MGAQGAAGVPRVTRSPHISARTWAPAPSSWSGDPQWYTERLTLDGEDWFARIRPGTDPALPPIVMLHGVIISGAYFRPIANALDACYTVYVPDLPGVGGLRSKARWTLPLWTEHLSSWLDAHGLRGAIVVGNSFGCQLATHLATVRPDLVHSLVLVAPTLDPRISSIPEVIAKSALVFPRERVSIWATWIPDFFKTGPLRAFRMVRQMFRDDQLGRLEHVRHAAVVIGGAWDTISPPAWVHDMASRLPRGTSRIIPNAPHALNYSRPHDLVDAITHAVAQAVSDPTCP